MAHDDSNDDFDLVDWTPQTSSPAAGGAPAPKAARADKPILRAEQVAAVRFHTQKSGYAFAQVETFVDQVEHTLTALEHAMYERDLIIHEQREEVADLQDRNATLAATIEVFRAKGDPMVASDGSYVTESTAGQHQQSADMSAQLQQWEQAYSGLEAHANSLQATIQQLQAQLASAIAERDEANAAEAELRAYVETTLAEWFAQQASVATPATPEPVAQPAPAPAPLPEPVVQHAPEPEPAEPFTLEPENEIEFLASLAEQDADDPADYLGGDDWAGAPTLMPHHDPEPAPPAVQMLDTEPEEEPALEALATAQDLATEQPSAPRLAILTSAPELASAGITPETLPPAEGASTMELPPPPVRQRAPLTTAPELTTAVEPLADEEG